MTKTFVYAAVQKEGYHNFPESAILESFATNDDMDVSHLAAKHMHYFSIKVWVEVTHSNRDIEFIQLRRWLDKIYGFKTIDFGSKSCEMMCNDLFAQLLMKYPHSSFKIDISEDNINGAFLEYTP